ncbi:MAG TPA: hypothetical protein VHV30_12155 [Polyangiaceae bacterium]|jgi:hypothetical protein|nr:hypothetical protein [Polyangiaceae bacterium]
MTDGLDRRCGSCARFVRVFETIDANGEVRRTGDCLLGVWPSPLYETNTCSQWVQRGAFKARPPERTPARASRPRRPGSAAEPHHDDVPAPLTLPEDLLDMDADEFKRVLSQVIREEIGGRPLDLGSKWDGGEVILKPGKDGLQDKHIPIDTLFNKIIMIRDRLRVLEQKINTHPKLTGEEKVQFQQYVTGCYGSLTTFNVLFANREDHFVGQKGDE